MATKIIVCPRCDGRGELLRSMARLPTGERCNVCDGSGSLEIVCKPAIEPLTPKEQAHAEATKPDVCEHGVQHVSLDFHRLGGASLSWSGFNVYGDRASIDHVRELINRAHYRDYFQGLLITDRNELARLRRLDMLVGPHISPRAG